MAIPFPLVFLLCLTGGMLLSGTGSASITTVQPSVRAGPDKPLASPASLQTITQRTGSVNSTTVQPLGGCLAGWTPFENRCFIVRNSPSTFVDAQQICIVLGGNLASIHDENQSDFVRKLIRARFGSNVPAWIGLFDALAEGRYMWTDGSPLDYTDWAPGEPNNNNGTENCVSVSTDNGFPGWNDLSCARSLPFVCSRNRPLPPV